MYSFKREGVHVRSKVSYHEDGLRGEKDSIGFFFEIWIHEGCDKGNIEMTVAASRV